MRPSLNFRRCVAVLAATALVTQPLIATASSYVYVRPVTGFKGVALGDLKQTIPDPGGSTGGSNGGSTGGSSGGTGGGSTGGSGGDTGAGTGTPDPAVHGELSVSPLSRTFGDLQVGQTAQAQAVTVQNTGAGPLSLSGVSVTAGATDFAQSNNCGTTLLAGTSCTVSVGFTPSAAGARSGLLMISSEGGAWQAVALSGNAVAPQFSVSQTNVVLSSLAVGSQVSQTIRVRNTGLGSLDAPSFELTGADSARFTATSTCSGSLVAGATCDIAVSFSATDVGDYAAVLGLSALGAASKAVSFTLGVVPPAEAKTPPQLTLATTSLSFASTVLGNTTAAQSVQVSNSGSGDAVLGSVAITAGASDFSTTTDCPATLPAGQGCTVSVSFNPTVAGYRYGTLVVTPQGGSAYSVALQGIGTKPSLMVSPGSLSFGHLPMGLTSPSQAVTLTNGTSSTVSIGSIGLSTGRYFNQTNDCPSSLTAGASCQVQVFFSPGVSGSASDVLSIPVVMGDVKYVNVSGYGDKPTATLSAPTFAGVEVGGFTTAVATLTNTGTGPLTLTVPSGSSLDNGDFHFQSTTCGASLAGGAACTVTVSFQPTKVGSRTGYLTITSVVGSIQAKLTGTALQGDLRTSGPSVANDVLSFSPTQVGTSGGTRNITLTNKGQVSLSISGVSVTWGQTRFAQSNDCGLPLAPNESCTVAVAFTPTSKDINQGTLTVTHNGTFNGVPTSYGYSFVSLLGEGAAAVVAASPTSVSFGNQLIGTTSDSQTVVLTNSGIAEATITGISVTTGASSFGQNNNCGAPLSVGQSCSVTVAFTPGSANNGITGYITVLVANGSAVTLTLTGRGVAPITALAPSTGNSVNFGSVAPKSTMDQAYVFANTGTAGATGVYAMLSGSATASIVSNDCGTSDARGTLAAEGYGSWCTVVVRYAPMMTDSMTATLSLYRDGLAAPATLSLRGTSTGTAVAELDQQDIIFGNKDVNTTSTATINLVNTGTANLTVTTAGKLTGDSAYTLSNACTTGLLLSPNAQCAMTVSFKPTAIGNVDTVLSVVTSVGTKTLNLTGNGLVATASLAAGSGQSVNFGTVTIPSSSTQTFTFTNTGNKTITGVSAQLLNVVNGYTLVAGSTTCGVPGSATSLALGQSCNIAVQFTPSATGSASATLSVASSASNGTQTLALTGTGQAQATISSDVSSVGFTAAAIGATSAETKAVVLTNTGGAALVISGVTVPTGGTSFSASGCVTTLGVNASCTITVSFTPQAATNTGTLRIVSSATNTPTLDIPLSGNGNASPLLSITTANPVFASAPIGYLSTETKTVTLKNTGTATLTVSSIAFTPTTTVFSKSGSCTSLAANATCSVTLSFTPSAVSNSANLRVLSNAANTPTKDIAVSGTGRNAGLITITKAVYNYNVTISSSGNLTSSLKAYCLNKAQCTFDPLTVLGSDPSPNNAKNMELTYTCSSTGSTSYSYSAAAEAGLRNHTITCP